MPEPIRIFTEKLINDVLYNAQLNNLSVNTYLETNAGSINPSVAVKNRPSSVNNDLRSKIHYQQTQQQLSPKSIFTYTEGDSKPANIDEDVEEAKSETAPALTS